MVSKKTLIMTLGLMIVTAFFLLFFRPMRGKNASVFLPFFQRMGLRQSGKLKISSIAADGSMFVDGLPDQQCSAGKSCEGIVLPLENFILKTSKAGVLQFLAKEGEIVKKDSALAEIENEESQKEAQDKQDAFNEDISSIAQDIQIAREDITDIEQEIDNLKNTIRDKEYSFADAEREYRQGLIDEKAFTEKKEEFDTLKNNLYLREEMLKTKFINIASFEKRTKELRMLADQISKNLLLRAPYDGVVREVLARVGESVNENTPLLKLAPHKLVPLQLQGKSLLGLNGKRVKIIIQGAPAKEFSGILKIEDFSLGAGQAGERAKVEVTLDQDQFEIINESGKKVMVLSQVNTT